MSRDLVGVTVPHIQESSLQEVSTFKKGDNECDILCQRTEGLTSAYVLFHLKDWPCGPDECDNKGRCSPDGKCEVTSKD